MPKADSSSVPKKRATAKRASAATAKRVASARKAPTRRPVSAPMRGASSAAKLFVALFVGVLIIIGVSYFIGTSDNGAINVSSVISEKADMQAAKGDVSGSEAIRALKNTNPAKNLPNGGLVGSGNRDTRQQELEKQRQVQTEAASSAATSSDATSSSTEDAMLEESEPSEDEAQAQGTTDVTDEATE